MKLYTSTQVEQLVNNYLERNGECIQLNEGTLGHGKLLLSAPGKKYAVIQEKYLNAWSSGHTIRFYNECPQKYKGRFNIF